jgi:4-phospho-D-threonate 3-dehydrogenase / 4-phospho-D-erythronate 3-dehydrogenase
MTPVPPPRIAVTMGDPAGIGPENCLHRLNDPTLAAPGVPVVFGDAGVLRRVAAQLKIPFTAPVVTEIS